MGLLIMMRMTMITGDWIIGYSTTPCQVHKLIIWGKHVIGSLMDLGRNEFQDKTWHLTEGTVKSHNNSNSGYLVDLSCLEPRTRSLYFSNITAVARHEFIAQSNRTSNTSSAVIYKICEHCYIN
jgi:hypothetical protein